jgi:hypothetical protein
MFVRDFPDELHQHAKLLAALRGETLKALVERAIQAEVERIEATEGEALRQAPGMAADRKRKGR